ncbi:MAG: hypothetical protein U0996_24065 [Planctomycetaceae bacterium]
MSLLPRHFFCSLTLLTAGLLSVSTAEAQQMYYPFSDRVPPGYTAEMMARVRQDDPYYLQPIRIELPSEGTVAIYSANPEPSAVLAAPALASVNAGHLYRLRVADMPELPGVELYPSIEILDRLHPPVGRTLNYPIPIVLTKDDLEAAANGQLVTRVVYLEEPQLAATQDPLRRDIPISVPQGANALEEAERLGRPMVIVRIGGRTPTAMNTPISFFGTGGAVDLGKSVPVNAGVARLSNKPRQQAAGVVQRTQN